MTAHRSTTRRLALAVTALAATAALAACGGDSGETTAETTTGSTTETTTEEHNAADVSFAQGMIPHHRQAVEMARLAAERAASPEVTELATRIDEAQQPEIDTLTGWLEGWGEQVPAAGNDEEASDMGHDGHDMSGEASGGMAGEQDMAELESASGEEFDALFLELMIEHHEGAVSMAETERADGAYAPATEMAEDIVASQSAEIDEMNALLGEG